MLFFPAKVMGGEKKSSGEGRQVVGRKWVGRFESEWFSFSFFFFLCASSFSVSFF